MRATYIPPEDNKDPLEKFTINLTNLAKKGKLDPVIGRDGEIRRLIQILSRRTKNNPALLGDPGVGKTAIVEGLAQRIVSGDVPDTLKHKQVLVFDMAGILAGASFRGEFEKRLKTMIKKIEKSEGKYILFLDELHTIVGAGGAQGAVDASNMLKPALARGTLHAIGATTVQEYRKYIEKDAALERRFQPVYIDEPSVEDAITILRGIKEKYETHHGIKISDDALITAVNLSVRYITDRYLPDKAIDLIDEAAAAAKIEIDSMPTVLDEAKRKLIQLDIELAALKKEKGVEERKKKLEKEREEKKKEFDSIKKRWKRQKEIISNLQKTRLKLDKLKADLEIAERDVLLDKAAELKYSKIPEAKKELKKLEAQWKKLSEGERLLKEKVTQEDVAQIVARWTSIPTTKLLSSEAEKLKKLENEMKSRVVGQDHALERVASAIRRSRAGLSEEDRPIGAFLFLGPTGVGKTETGKTLAHSLFNDEKGIIRIDLSEYQEAHTVARLIGAPPGYVGHEEGGQLTEAVRRKPYSVILLDEMEKAHPQVFNIFLQVLDEGRLTDGRGRTVNFKNTVLIFTSNIGSDILASDIPQEEKKNKVKEKMKKTLKPEFINRLDAMILFNPLTKEVVKKIVDIQLKRVKVRLEKQELEAKFSPSLKNHLASAGFDQVYGARPLKRLVDELIVNEIASLIIERKIKPGDKLSVDYRDDKVTIKVVK